MDTKCIFALGNPGKEYCDTRHNVAQWVFSYLGRRSLLNWEVKQKLFANICSWVTDSPRQKLMLVKPMVYMNESGKTVTSICSYYGFNHSEVMVIHDELDLPPGSAKIQFGGNSAGHNGVSDIYRAFGNHNLKRLRIGIGHPRSIGLQQSVSSFVLQKPTSKETEAIQKIVGFCSNSLSKFAKMDTVEANSYLQQGVKKWG